MWIRNKSMTFPTLVLLMPLCASWWLITCSPAVKLLPEKNSMCSMGSYACMNIWRVWHGALADESLCQLACPHTLLSCWIRQESVIKAEALQLFNVINQHCFLCAFVTALSFSVGNKTQSNKGVSAWSPVNDKLISAPNCFMWGTRPVYARGHVPVFSREVKCICIRIEQHPKITHLYVSRVPSW